jgi:hypothetical protein
MIPANRTPNARKIHATLDEHETRLRLVEASRFSDGEKLDGISADMRQLRASFDELSRDVRNVLMHERDAASEASRKRSPGIVMTHVKKSIAASLAVLLAALAGGAAAVAQSCGHQTQLSHPYPAVSAQK